MREIWFAILVALTVVGARPALAQAPNSDTATPDAAKPDATKVASLLMVGKDDRVLGKPDAPITIIEYGSLSCPHCAHFATEVLPKLQAKWIDTGKARLVFRDFPLDEPALRAEMIARCAPPERYYPLIDALFANQDKWVLEKDYRAALERLVLLAGIGKKQVEACLANKKVEDQVAGSRLVAAQQLAVDATPTFFVNGKKFDGAPTEEAFDQLLTGLAAKS